MKKILIIIGAFLLLMACCHQDDEDEQPETFKLPGEPSEPRGYFDRTVLLYASAENKLSPFLPDELKELKKGSRGMGNNALLVYVDDAAPECLPYIAWIKEGAVADSIVLDSDDLSSSPETMSRILNIVSTYYPANEYGLVLWGHASGWVMEDSIDNSIKTAAPRRAFGVDNGKNSPYSDEGKWLNMNTLASILKQWKHLKFIFADCCQFQCIESAYELREVTDYIIGSPAEIPGEGAPYETLTSTLFSPSETFYQEITDCYFNQVIKISDVWPSYDSQTPLSVIRTQDLPILAEATNRVLHSFLPLDNGSPYPVLTNLIYYRGNTSSRPQDLMYDMNDFILHYADPAHYAEWKTAFDNVVVYKKNAKNGWMTNRQVSTSTFKWLTDERYGGVSMFVPQDRKGTWYEPYTDKGIQHNGYNADIRKTSWYVAARLAEFEW